MFAGFMLYTKKVEPDNKYLHTSLASANLCFFLVILAILELQRWDFLRKFVALEKPVRVMKRDEFERLISQEG